MTKNYNKAKCYFHIELKNQPIWELSRYRGPTLLKIEDALAAAEKGIDDGAQHAIVYVYPDYTHNWTEKWVCTTDKKWRKFDRPVTPPRV